MNDKKQNITKIALFGGIFLLLLFIFSMMMQPQKWFDDKLVQNRDSRYIQITEQPDETIDVLNIGDSLSITLFSPMELWREQGFTSSNIGADGLRMAESYYYIKNACKKQNPRILMIESLYLFRYSMGDDTTMLLSQPIYYRVPFLKYHNIWKALVEKPGVMIYHRGYTVNKDVNAYEGLRNYLDYPIADPNQKLYIPSFNKAWFARIKKFCDDQGIRIIIYSAASAQNYNWERVNALKAFAEEHGVDYIDLNEHTKEMGINWMIDTNDDGDHMNYYGCVKSTKFLGQYLKENTDLTDHRGDEAYSDWDEELLDYDQLVQDMGNLSFQNIYNVREFMFNQNRRLREEAKNIEEAQKKKNK